MCCDVADAGDGCSWHKGGVVVVAVVLVGTLHVYQAVVGWQKYLVPGGGLDEGRLI